MSEPLTSTEAAARFNISYTRVTELCRSGHLASAHKARPASGGQRCWQIDPVELQRFLRENPREPNEGSLPEPWSPIVAPAREGEPTDLQLEVLAGEWWHDLVNMQLRPNGDLWTRWSDGERFIIRPDGEMDRFRYERIGFEYRQHERERNANAAA